MNRAHFSLFWVLAASLLVGCGTRPRGGGGGDGDGDGDGDVDGDDDDDVTIDGEGEGEGEGLIGQTAIGAVSGQWNDADVDGDVAFEILDGIAQIDFALQWSDGSLLLSGHSGYEEVDRFGNVLATLYTEGPELGSVDITLSGNVEDGHGEWYGGDALVSSGSGTWSLGD